MRRFAILMGLLGTTLGATTSGQTVTKTVQLIPVFVTSAGAVGGLTDPNKGNQDTVKDLRDSLKRYKDDILLVDSRSKAMIALIVEDREKAQVTATVFGPGRDCTVRVELQYEDLKAQMSASAAGGTLTSGGAWSKAAGKVAKQVDEWIRANKDKLIGGL